MEEEDDEEESGEESYREPIEDDNTSDHLLGPDFVTETLTIYEQ